MRIVCMHSQPVSVATHQSEARPLQRSLRVATPLAHNYFQMCFCKKNDEALQMQERMCEPLVK